MMKKTDLILIAAVLAVSAILYAVFYESPSNGSRVRIYVDGELVRTEAMTDTGSQVVIDNAHGSNIIEIGPGSVEVIWSDCASQVCVRTGKISRPGEVIVCLPHHLLITIEGVRNPEDIDAIAW